MALFHICSNCQSWIIMLSWKVKTNLHWWVKSQSKELPKWMDILKLHFYMFERSQGKHNSLNVIIFFRICSLNYKVYMLKVWHKSKMFLHVQSTQTLKVNNFCFFQTSFFPTKCAPYLLKLGKNFNIDD